MPRKPLESRPARHGLLDWRHRWRTLASLLASLVILGVMMYSGLFGRSDDGSVDWTHVAVYLCSVVVFVMQVDRLFHRTG